MTDEKWKMENPSFCRLPRSTHPLTQVVLTTAHCSLLFVQFTEMPNVLFSELIPIGLTKKRHNLVAVF
jgi:hypothetical protein